MGGAWEGPFSEKTGPDPDHRGPRFDRDSQITGHSHVEPTLGPCAPFRYVAYRAGREVTPCRFHVRRGHSHEAHGSYVAKIGPGRDQARQAVRVDSRFADLFAELDLNSNVEDSIRLFPLTRQGLHPPKRVDAINDFERIDG